MLLGSVVALVALTGTVSGCADENDPQTHIDKLDDPVTRTSAVTRLIQFYEDAMTKDKKNREGENVKPLLDKIVEPLAKVAAGGDLDKRAQGKLLSFLADTRDKRAASALVAALEAYKPDDKRPDQFDSDMGDVVRACGMMKLDEAKKPLLELFIRLQASWPKASYKQFYLVLHDALLELNDKSWESRLVAQLNRPINSLKDIKNLKNEVYWQTTSAKLLGNQKSAAAVVPLIKVVLSPLKADVAKTAVSALIKIGKPAIDEAVKLLNGEAKELEKYSEDENLKSVKDRGGKIDKNAKKAAEVAHIGAAAIIVGTIGRKEGIAPMLQAIEKGNDLSKAIIARELPKLPASPEVTEAFKKVYSESSLTLTIPPGFPAREALLEAAGTFFDASLAPWLIEEALGLKGEEADTAPIQDATLAVTMKLAKEEHIELLEKLAAVQVTYPQKTTIGKAYKKELDMTKKVLKACSGKGVECWMAKLVETESQQKQTQFQGIKAAYMIGVLGDDKVRPKIVEQLPLVTNAAVRFVAVSVLDRLSPKGDKEMATKLQAIVDANVKSRDKSKIQADAPLKTIIHRLEARAQ
jgi:hypothetical protein